MRTRREQMQAYRFVIRRIVAAVLAGEPETLDRPMRRLGISLFVSAMLAVIVFAGFGVYGVIVNPGGELEENTLVIERDTGATYVFFEDRLHPVLNIASARLILGEPADPRQVSPASLVDTPRGPTLGIRDAPDALPDADDLIGLPWRVCSVPPTGGQTEPTTTVVVDRHLAGEVSSATDQGLYVSAGPDQHYLLWNDMRLRVPDPAVAVVALRLPTQPVPVGEPLLNTVTAGPELAAPGVDGAGEEFAEEIGGEPAEVGEVFEAGGQHYVLTADGLARIGEVSWALLAAEGATARSVPAAEAGRVGVIEIEPEGFPQAVPPPHPEATGDPTVCTAYLGEAATGALGTRIEVLSSTPDALSSGAEALPVPATRGDPVTVADRVVIAGGRGALVRAVPHAGATPDGGTVFLVTDQGIRYPLAEDAPEALGYGGVDPVAIPGELLGMVPTGPELSQAEAMWPARRATGERPPVG